MKKLLSIFISFTLLFNVIPAFTVNAATYGKFYFEIDYHGIDPYIRITGYDTSDFSSERILEIPSEIDGIPVEEIGYQAFMGAFDVDIPSDDPIRDDFIGDIAVGIPDFDTIRNDFIGDIAVGFSSSINSIAKVANDNKIENIVLPNSIKRIESQAFANCSSLKQIHIPGGVKYIADDAFKGDSKLTICGPQYKYITKLNQIINLGTTYVYEYAISHGIPFHAIDEVPILTDPVIFKNNF